MKRLIFACCFLLLSSVVHAQAPAVSPPVTLVRITVSGGVAPVTNDIPLVNITGPVACTPVPPGTTANPSAFQYKVLSTDTQCWQYTDPGNGPLKGLPIGGAVYTAVITFVNSNGPGPLSNVSNSFTRPGTAPTTAPLVFGVLP